MSGASDLLRDKPAMRLYRGALNFLVRRRWIGVLISAVMMVGFTGLVIIDIALNIYGRMQLDWEFILERTYVVYNTPECISQMLLKCINKAIDEWRNALNSPLLSEEEMARPEKVVICSI